MTRTHPQTFVQARALDSLATFAQHDAALMPTVQQSLRELERSGSKALAARARKIRSRLPAGRVRSAAASGPHPRKHAAGAFPGGRRQRGDVA